MDIKWSRVSRRRELRAVNAERVSNGRIPMIRPSDWLIDWLIIGQLVYPRVTVTQSREPRTLHCDDIFSIAHIRRRWWYSDVASYTGWIMQQLLLCHAKVARWKKRCNLVLLISFFQKDAKATFVFSRDFLICKKKLIIPNYRFLWRATFVMQYFFFLCKKMYTRIILLHILVFFNRNENYGFIKSP